MRITTRTPPIRIAAAHMVAMAELPAEHAGLALRWGMRRYAGGQGVPLDEARRDAGMDARAWATLIQSLATLLDAQALQAGFVVVVPFAEAADALAKVSASKVRAVRAVESAAALASGAARPRAPSAATPRMPAPTGATVDAPTGDATGPGPVDEVGVPAAPARRARRSTAAAVDADPWDALAAALADRGEPASEIAEAIARWRQRHPLDEVVTQLQSIADRRIAKPVRYLETMLKNLHSSRRQAMPSEIRIANSGPLLPRPVKRRIKVDPRAGWAFEGWTARGHPRGGALVADRREVWRNDSGTLSYKMPDPESGRTTPEYEEDAGVYEAD